MYFPIVGERVWIHDSPHAFVVLRIDYAPRLATILAVSGDLAGDYRPLLENVPLASLLVDAPTAASRTVDQETVQRVLRTSSSRVGDARHLIADLRESIAVTMETIRQSGLLLAESDELIARSRSLNRAGKRPGEARPRSAS